MVGAPATVARGAPPRGDRLVGRGRRSVRCYREHLERRRSSRCRSRRVCLAGRSATGDGGRYVTGPARRDPAGRDDHRVAPPDAATAAAAGGAHPRSGLAAPADVVHPPAGAAAATGTASSGGPPRRGVLTPARRVPTGHHPAAIATGLRGPPSDLPRHPPRALRHRQRPHRARRARCLGGPTGCSSDLDHHRQPPTNDESPRGHGFRNRGRHHDTLNAARNTGVPLKIVLRHTAAAAGPQVLQRTGREVLASRSWAAGTAGGGGASERWPRPRA